MHKINKDIMIRNVLQKLKEMHNVLCNLSNLHASFSTSVNLLFKPSVMEEPA